MYQILFRLPGFLPFIGGAPIYGYGVMMVVGFYLSMELAKYLARKSKLDPEIFANAALIGLVAGVAGARLSHVLENFGDYTRSDLSFTTNLWNAINIRSGGLTYYGGFLLAFPALIAYGWFKRVPLRLGMDIIAPCLMVGLGLGRVGCYLNGCCYGAETNAEWAVQFPYRSDAYLEQVNKGEIQPPPQLLNANGAPRSIEDIEADRTIGSAERSSLVALAESQRALPVHPAELYSTFTAFLIAAFVLAYFTLRHAPGRVFALMLMVEGVSRFLLETVRAEPVGTFFGHHIFGPLTFGEGTSVVIVLMGAVLWFMFGLPQIWVERGSRGVGSAVAA
jgi:phosphatidylglycerol:prolipoprotein diacylglycerol transferase